MRIADFKLLPWKGQDSENSLVNHYSANPRPARLNNSRRGKNPLKPADKPADQQSNTPELFIKQLDFRNSLDMPQFLHKFIGLMILFSSIGIASCQALLGA